MTHNELVVHNDTVIREIRRQLLAPIELEIAEIDKRIKKLKLKAYNAAYWQKYKASRKLARSN